MTGANVNHGNSEHTVYGRHFLVLGSELIPLYGTSGKIPEKI